MPNYWGENLFATAFVDENTYGETPAVPSWIVMVSTRPEVNFGRSIEDLGLSTSTDFSTQPKVVGTRHEGSTFTFRVPLRDQLSTYDDPTDSLAQNPELLLLQKAMGTKHTGTSVAADIAALSTACVWELTAATPDEGACYYTGTNGAQTANTLGWVTDLTGTTATIFEDGIAIPAAGEDLYGMYTFASDASQPSSFSFRYKGASDDHDVILQGCMIETVTLTMNSGMVPVLEFSCRFDDWRYDTASGDGLLSGTEYVRLAPIMGVHQGRVTIDGGSTGTADATGTCGIGNLQVEITNELQDLACHGGDQGFSNVLVLRRMARVSFTIPYTTDYITGTNSDWDLSLENGTTKSMMVQVGKTVGQMFSLFIPEAVVVEQAQLGPQDGIIGWSVVMEPDDGYSGDSGSTFPANTSFRIALG